MEEPDYWKERFKQLEEAQNALGESSLTEIEEQYRQAQREIERKIARWHQRLADNNGITLVQARQYLKGADLKEFKWDVRDYIKHGQKNALDGLWMKELENASAKYHISKLEALKIQTRQSLEVMFSKQLGTVTRAMGDVYKSGFFHTAYELQHGFGIGWDIAGLDQRQIEKVLAKPWAVDGKNFSERIWGNKQKLISEVHGELTQNIMLGADPQKAIDSLAKKMNNSKYNAGRLVMTEEAYFSSAAQKLSFEKLNAVVQTGTAAKRMQGVKLFIAPEIQVKPGSKIIVEQNGVTTEYSASGVPAVYLSHAEIMLELFGGWD